MSEKKYNCKYCNYSTDIRQMWYQHNKGKKHLKNVQNAETRKQIEMEKKITDEVQYNLSKSKKNLKSIENNLKVHEKHSNELKIIKKDKKFICPECQNTFVSKKTLDIHLKKSCKMHIEFNNIYSFDGKTLGKNKYGEKGGEIYIIQTDYNFNDIFKVGRTTNLYQRLSSYRCGSAIEPRLHFYYPFPDIYDVDYKLKLALKDYNLKREIYQIDMETLRSIIKNLQKKISGKEDEHEPIINDTDISECKGCNEIFYSKESMFLHLKDCKDYQKNFITIKRKEEEEEKKKQEEMLQKQIERDTLQEIKKEKKLEEEIKKEEMVKKRKIEEEDRKKEEILVKFMEKQAEELRIREEKQAEELRIREEKQAEEQRKVIEEQRKREERLLEEQRRRDEDQRKMFELLILSQTNKQVYKEYNEYLSETQDPKDTEIQELKKELEEIKQLVKGQKGIDNSNSSQNHHNHNSGTIFEVKHQNNLLNNLNLNYTNVISMNQFLYNMEHVNKIPRSDLEAIAFASENMKEVDLAETIHRTIEKNCMEQTKGMINPADGLELLPVMPVVCSDGNCRSHKEKVNEFWETVYGDKHFDRMLNIIDKRLYEVLKKKFYLEDYGKKQLFKKIKKKHTIHDMKDMQNKINGEILGKKFKVI